MEETSVYRAHNSLKKVITVFQRFDPNNCNCTLGVSKFQLQTGLPVHFSVAHDMSHDCVKYMSILLCGWPNFRLTRDATRALPTLIAGLFTPSSIEQKKWHHIPGSPFAYYYRGSKFTAITLVLVFLYCCLYIDVNRFTYLNICLCGTLTTC